VYKGDARAADAVAEMKKVLTPEQAARLSEISYQVRGGAALADVDVAAALKLTKKQSEDVSATWKREEASLKDFLARARFASQEAMRSHIAGHRRKAAEKMLEVLTDDQKKQYTKMQGRAFDTAGLDRE
jgi:Spy/CpxP family protein refolding chaperone